MCGLADASTSRDAHSPTAPAPSTVATAHFGGGVGRVVSEAAFDTRDGLDHSSIARRPKEYVVLGSSPRSVKRSREPPGCGTGSSDAWLARFQFSSVTGSFATY